MCGLRSCARRGALGGRARPCGHPNLQRCAILLHVGKSRYFMQAPQHCLPPKLATLRNIAPCRKIALFHASSTTKPAKQTQLRMRCCPDAADAGTAWRRIASALWCSGAEGCTVYINAAPCGHRSCGRASHPAKVTERHDVHIQTRERPVKCCPALEPRQPRP